MWYCKKRTPTPIVFGLGWMAPLPDLSREAEQGRPMADFECAHGLLPGEGCLACVDAPYRSGILSDLEPAVVYSAGMEGHAATS